MPFPAPAISLAQAQAQLTLWLAAEAQISTTGQEYSVQGRAYRAADLGHVAERITFYQQLVDRLSNSPRGGVRVRRAVPLDYL
jgi:hypothetical protein